MIPQDPKGINFLLSSKKKSLKESLISLFNHTLIRSNRGTSYTWHFVRLQREKKTGCISPLQRRRQAHQTKTKTTQSDKTAGRELREWGSELLKPHSRTKGVFGRSNPDWILSLEATQLGGIE